MNNTKYHSSTTTLCPKCRKLIDGVRVIRDGKVYLQKNCPDCGKEEALISGDSEWFLKSFDYLKQGKIPYAYSTETKKGCPHDCGLCPDHEQHTCLPIIEITNHCNMSCPICLVENKHSYYMPISDFENIINGLIEKEGHLANINLSGGEPTIHPQFLDLLDIAVRRDEIARVSISTNGLKIAQDFEFCKELASRGVYVSLQLDGFDDETLYKIRGLKNLYKIKKQALENLEKAGVKTSIVMTVSKNINDKYIGDFVRYLFDSSIVSLMFQPAAYTGTGADFPEQEALTIPDVIHAIETQTEGMVKMSDFMPLPCSHPNCFALSYFLKTENGYTPFARFINHDKYVNLVANRGILEPDKKLEETMVDTINDLWICDCIPHRDEVLVALKKATKMYSGNASEKEKINQGEDITKTIFLHGFMDKHTFDIERVKKCCNHYALPDGRLIPACVYNNVKGYRS